MNQNIKIITQNCCEDLLTFSSRPELRAKYNYEKYNSSSLEFLKIPTKYFLDEAIPLGITSKDDCQSSISIYKQLKNLDKVQANDKRLWVCLTHTIFFDYTRKRWGINSESSDNTIISRFHFEGAGIEARMRNAISRLWWAAKITFDESRDNKFELTELLWEKQDVYTAIVERSFATYPNVVHGFLEFYKNNKKLKEDELRAILRGLNSIGGVKILPLMSKQEIVDEIKRISDFSKIAVA
jgi:hypothetical protein